MGRTCKKSRTTAETSIELSIDIDGSGKSRAVTGIGFFEHMLTLFSKHGIFDMQLEVEGDLHVDFHHTVEDVAIVLGSAFKEALGEKKGINRYGLAYTPMDEALTRVSLDIGGRPYLSFEYDFERDKVGEFDTELVEEFLRGFSNSLGANIHVDVIRGRNTHHIIESIFKGLGRAMSQAASINERITGVMSTKGVI
ncbi:imidazoleglycerol-phosphate dehydratase [Peptoclostridium litorale DSM 5388]|uniref:Imidazoleglycerol-phosphate dehydratase n=1 Tax=Peptoclostridium litorale DSM 5388 TaxID=1121324 RepID=A0A069REE2_PEPLI|nr:imidazoleglycerol-phosphate dehydratase HisB [Peptoclostridium litorale]KDR95103.1 imidazoleglycerol-phosphate dehydratase HisB [Peptoclostridium litorale DSM 5388]SIN74965.1 imidazoleglycerol-phosphate dehydratase [Peptoclostridium litorale DSM 5388]